MMKIDDVDDCDDDGKDEEDNCDVDGRGDCDVVNEDDRDVDGKGNASDGKGDCNVDDEDDRDVDGKDDRDVDGKGKESDVCGTTRAGAWGWPDRAIRNRRCTATNMEPVSQYTLVLQSASATHTNKIHWKCSSCSRCNIATRQATCVVCVQFTLVYMCGHLIEGQSALTSIVSLTLHFRRQQDGPKICRTQQGRLGMRVCSDM